MCVAVERRESIQTMKKWYGIMDFIFASATDWMPIPVMICWSEKERSSLRMTLDSVLRLASPRMMTTERKRDVPAVTIKESRTFMMISDG